MPRSDGKPAGWRYFDEQFWQRGEYLKCHDCKKESAKSASADVRHSPFCEKYEGGTRVVLDEAEVAERQALRGQRMETPIDAELRREPIEKRGKPEISDVYRRWVKQDRCCNCGEGPCDPHHEDTVIPRLKRGVGQKARDTLCVSLCRRCHDSLELPGGGYRLPCVDGSHTRAESLAILHDAQEARLRRALDLLPQEWRIECLSKGIASAPESVLRAALLADTTGGEL